MPVAVPDIAPEFAIVPDTVPGIVPEVVSLYTEVVLLFAPDIAPERCVILLEAVSLY